MAKLNSMHSEWRDSGGGEAGWFPQHMRALMLDAYAGPADEAEQQAKPEGGGWCLKTSRISKTWGRTSLAA